MELLELKSFNLKINRLKNKIKPEFKLKMIFFLLKI